MPQGLRGGVVSLGLAGVPQAVVFGLLRARVVPLASEPTIPMQQCKQAAPRMQDGWICRIDRYAVR